MPIKTTDLSAYPLPQATDVVAVVDLTGPTSKKSTIQQILSAGILAMAQVTGLVAALAGKAATTDSRFTDARTPTAHAASHAAGSTDVVTLTEAQITGLVSDLAGKATLSFTKLATGVTGAQNDYTPGLVGHTIEYWSGVADAAFTGLVGGVAGQLYTLKNTGTKIATFANQSASSSAGNKFTNIVTSGVTPVAPRGFITYQYDGTDWQLVDHEQGGWITPAYSAGDFTASGSMTWTVDSGDVGTYAYKLDGNRLSVVFTLNTTSVGGTPSTVLLIAVPGGFVVSKSVLALSLFARDNGVTTAGYVFVDPALNAGVKIRLDRLDEGNWSAVSTNNTAVDGQTSFAVT